MALVKCHECGNQVSTEADACPSCGAKVKRHLGPLQAILTVGVILIIIGAIANNASSPDATAPQSNAAAPEVKKEKPKTNFFKPLETTSYALVCPVAILADRREGKGLEAAMRAATTAFGRSKAIEEAGCEEWKAGTPVNLNSDEEKSRAAKLQEDGKCGFVRFEGSMLVLSCDLQNEQAETLADSSAQGGNSAHLSDPAATNTPSSQSANSAFPGQRKEVARVQSRDEYTKSFNGGFAYILEERYATSDEVVQINMTTGAKRDVIDGNFVQVVRTGKYSGWILTARHRYYPQGGSYECVFVVRPDGKESFQINSQRAKSDNSISSLVATLDSEDVECGGVTQASGK